MVRDLDEARLLGNWSLRKRLDFSYAEVADVASLIKEEAAFLLYVQPEQRVACSPSGARDGHRTTSP
ncbi:hypothetical protein VR46_21505 [Streptomyces sp. NRRL S-444]|nr:hypothetical protein VR46_21505 [Streptomyces sp. NRRL S-444]